MDSQKCIWMEAGAVEYQLCPLKKNCDLCDFHKEMIRGYRTHCPQSASAKLSLRYPDNSVIQFQPGLQYLKGHFWYRRIAAGRIRLGIDSFLWQLFSSVQKVITPKNRSILIKDQCFSWLLLEGGIIYLRTPIPGKIIEINPIFQTGEIEDTHLYLAAENELWIMELEEDEPLTSDSLSRDQYFAQAKEDCHKFHKLIQTPEQSENFSPPLISQLSKNDFSKYLQTISNNHAFIC
ncbi:MAG: hypothetical protein HOD43_04960 [Candidatus Marinimicrobia bacterium]|jgi:glycine cleavage system H lipoate-binding protein|nr:hypothetical protein [Candidatus Neomarinimicrobiota bacterium]MBT3630751.1 hypothetical protein [Candidatus Neomarinimicrobiota bacterium]MBT3823888.1 hypothetical protein [Candidatus Neomarinimicrobiota bacterium]MBT4295138.1 hypothetical protein [Candidatus Neomarinimicrobiota bacterium]MBT4994164.1 hypothetical protein [Candidatus Neomarinimicrobiota bacterium]